MNLSSKKVLVINLETEETEVKTYKELHKFVGGIGLGLKLYELYYKQDPLIFSIGPLNGFYPFASKRRRDRGSIYRRQLINQNKILRT